MGGRPVIAVALALCALGAVALVSDGKMTTFLAGGLAGAVLVWLLSQGKSRPDGVRSGARRTRRSEIGIADMLDAAPNPCVLIDARVVVVHANVAARIAFPALKSGYLLSFSMRDPGLVAAVNACLLTGELRNVELIETVPVERSFACSVAPVRTDGPAHVLLVLRDTSGERAVESMRVDFVANASHELRTPLAAVLGLIETIQGPAREDAAARERFLAIMADQARRMARLVDDLLSLSRIEMKQHVAPTGQVDLAALLAETVRGLEHSARDRGVALKLTLPDEATVVAGDRDELLSVFDNLIENAIKYGRSGKRVEVTLESGAEATVRVRDFGPGIPPEHLPRLTERFYRVDNAVSRAEGGTGLGLALVKHTLRRHRGSLSIQSRPGEGATFSVTLPL